MPVPAYGQATEYEEEQILAIAFGIGTPDIASPYYCGISTTPIALDGSGAVEFSGLGYARVAVPGWDAPVHYTFATPSENFWHSTAVADLQFPDPAGIW